MSVESVSPATRDFTGLIRGASVVGLVLAVIMPPVGLVASIATLIWARHEGQSATLSIWGIVVSVVLIITGIILGFIALSMLTSAANAGALNIEALCADRRQWSWLIDSLRYVCR